MLPLSHSHSYTNNAETETKGQGFSAPLAFCVRRLALRLCFYVGTSDKSKKSVRRIPTLSVL